MDIDYWNRFLRTGSVEDYLHYRKALSTAAGEVIKEVANGKSTTDCQRSGTSRTANERER